MTPILTLNCQRVQHSQLVIKETSHNLRVAHEIQHPDQSQDLLDTNAPAVDG